MAQPYPTTNPALIDAIFNKVNGVSKPTKPPIVLPNYQARRAPVINLNNPNQGRMPINNVNSGTMNNVMGSFPTNKSPRPALPVDTDINPNAISDTSYAGDINRFENMPPFVKQTGPQSESQIFKALGSRTKATAQTIGDWSRNALGINPTTSPPSPATGTTVAANNNFQTTPTMPQPAQKVPTPPALGKTVGISQAQTPTNMPITTNKMPEIWANETTSGPSALTVGSKAGTGQAFETGGIPSNVKDTAEDLANKPGYNPFYADAAKKDYENAQDLTNKTSRSAIDKLGKYEREASSYNPGFGFGALMAGRQALADATGFARAGADTEMEQAKNQGALASNYSTIAERSRETGMKAKEGYEAQLNPNDIVARQAHRSEIINRSALLQPTIERMQAETGSQTNFAEREANRKEALDAATLAKHEDTAAREASKMYAANPDIPYDEYYNTILNAHLNKRAGGDYVTTQEAKPAVKGWFGNVKQPALKRQGGWQQGDESSVAQSLVARYGGDKTKAHAAYIRGER